MVGAVSTAGGLLLAGTLTSLSSWRWVLYLDVPLGLAIVLLAPFVLDEPLRHRGRFDLPGALIGTYFFLNQYFQQQHGWSALATACALLPLPVTMAVAAAVAVRLERRLGTRPLWATGAALLMTGNLWLSTLAAGDGYPGTVLPALVLLGAGMAFCVLPPTVLATSGLRGDEAGAASSVLNSAQSVGGSIGLATLVMVSSHTGGMTGGFATGAAFAGCALLAALFLRNR
ncbi:MFS transporter [Streptomyces sp. NBC_01231]|nr:MFS transporter [Streptomyces sp. NBC_01231]